MVSLYGQTGIDQTVRKRVQLRDVPSRSGHNFSLWPYVPLMRKLPAGPPATEQLQGLIAMRPIVG